MLRVLATFAVVVSLGLPGPSARAGNGCQPSWLPTFGGNPGTSDDVLAFAVHDDGSGQALYAGGLFRDVGGLYDVRYVARWDGSRWAALGAGLSGGVRALAVYDDGSGAQLYAGGAFTFPARIARWNGASWSGLGSGTNGAVNALAVYDEGAGPVLFAGGEFASAGGVASSGIARWDGTSWSSVGGGTSLPVLALATYDDGNGTALYVAGRFTSAGGVAANRIARWDGVSFTPLGTGLDNDVRALAVFDDGGGPVLYAGGNFTSAGGIAAGRIARWNGSSWLVPAGVNGVVRALTAYDDGSGPVLCVGGDFDVAAGGVSAPGIARWNGASWSALGSSTNPSVAALAVLDRPGGQALFAGGTFQTFADLDVGFVAEWDGASWSALGDGPNRPVEVLAVHDDGSGPALFAGGAFQNVGSLLARNVARWNGSGWAALPGLTRRVEALESHDDGSGPALYAGLQSTVMRWDGSIWSPLVSDLAMGPEAFVYALKSWDDGSGAALYAGGRFLVAGGVPASHVARWNGNSWSPLGAGLLPATSAALCIEEWDDGSGSALYFAGGFTMAGNVPAINIARWDGAQWSALPGGPTGPIRALAVHDDGSGPALYAGGQFANFSSIARWNGSAWSTVGSGLTQLSHTGTVNDLAVFDDGNGPALYAAGFFDRGTTDVARWNGASWSAVGAGILSYAVALEVYDDGSGGGTALFVGSQGVAYDSGDAYLAKWGCPSVSGSAFCLGDAATCPCGNAGLVDRGCDNAQGTGGVALALVGQNASNGATLSGSGFPSATTPTAVVLRSSTLAPAFAQGDGLSCLGASPFVRLAATRAVGGASTHALAHADGPGAYHYQLAYRNTPASYCTPAAFNQSNGIRIVWP